MTKDTKLSWIALRVLLITPISSESKPVDALGALLDFSNITRQGSCRRRRIAELSVGRVEDVCPKVLHYIPREACVRAVHEQRVVHVLTVLNHCQLEYCISVQSALTVAYAA